MKKLAILALLAWASLTHAAPVKLQGQGGIVGSSAIMGKRDHPIKITATDVNPKAGLIWRYDTKKLKAVSCIDTEKHFVGPPGTYEIEVWSVLLDATGKTIVDSTTVTLTILPADADPVVPKPDDPIPPKPVDPVIPTDPLTRSLQDAYNADTDVDKAKHKATFAKTFRTATSDEVLTKAKTLGGLFDAMGVLLGVDGAKGKIPKTQEAIHAYLAVPLPPVDRPLMAANKALIKTEFAKVAAALEALK